eukprot:419434-Lingulodinium_polyedra.AAC.1
MLNGLVKAGVVVNQPFPFFCPQSALSASLLLATNWQCAGVCRCPEGWSGAGWGGAGQGEVKRLFRPCASVVGVLGGREGARGSHKSGAGAWRGAKFAMRSRRGVQAAG